MTKEKRKFTKVVMELLAERVSRGWISDGTSQPRGPLSATHAHPVKLKESGRPHVLATALRCTQMWIPHLVHACLRDQLRMVNLIDMSLSLARIMRLPGPCKGSDVDADHGHGAC